MNLHFTRHSNRHRLAPMRVSFISCRKNNVYDVSIERRIRRDFSCTAVMFEVTAQQSCLINQLNGRANTQIPIAVS